MPKIIYIQEFFLFKDISIFTETYCTILFYIKYVYYNFIVYKFAMNTKNIYTYIDIYTHTYISGSNSYINYVKCLHNLLFIIS
jgi:hypothetical protein